LDNNNNNNKKLTSSKDSYNSLLDNVSLEASQAFDEPDQNQNRQTISLSKSNNNNISEENKLNTNDDDESNTTNPLFSSRTYVKVSVVRNLLIQLEITKKH
jgi:hypothetical protein